MRRNKPNVNESQTKDLIENARTTQQQILSLQSEITALIKSEKSSRIMSCIAIGISFVVLLVNFGQLNNQNKQLNNQNIQLNNQNIQLNHQIAVDTATLIKDYTIMLASGEATSWAAEEAFSVTPSGDPKVDKAIKIVLGFSQDKENPRIYNQNINFNRWLIDAFSDDEETRKASITHMLNEMSDKRFSDNVDMMFSRVQYEIDNKNKYWSWGLYNCLETLNYVDTGTLKKYNDTIKNDVAELRSYINTQNTKKKEGKVEISNGNEILLTKLAQKCGLETNDLRLKTDTP